MMEHFFHDTIMRTKYMAMDEFPGHGVFVEITVDDWSRG